MCTMLSDAGFFSGLWHGLIAVFSLVADIFWDVSVYDKCQNSWFYQFGFVLGVSMAGILSFQISPFILVLLFVAWLVWFIFGLVFYSLGIALVLIVAFFVYERLRERIPVRIVLGSRR